MLRHTFTSERTRDLQRTAHILQLSRKALGAYFIEHKSRELQIIVAEKGFLGELTSTLISRHDESYIQFLALLEQPDVCSFVNFLRERPEINDLLKTNQQLLENIWRRYSDISADKENLFSENPVVIEAPR